MKLFTFKKLADNCTHLCRSYPGTVKNQCSNHEHRSPHYVPKLDYSYNFCNVDVCPIWKECSDGVKAPKTVEPGNLGKKPGYKDVYGGAGLGDRPNYHYSPYDS